MKLIHVNACIYHIVILLVFLTIAIALMQLRCHSSNLLYQCFAGKYFLGIYLHNYLPPKRKLGVSVHLGEQWRDEVDLFVLKI